MYDDIFVASDDAVVYRIAVYKAIYPSVATLADVIAAIDHVSFASVLNGLDPSKIQ